ncbi:MAG: hypothetical protein NZ651_06395, partial [Candidatus Bipolaricaulota bacterium]|nr:hypothetical protein [Candidatus Bipolaricaulota bacterium]MDW8127384.1 hypothetical protein [Candidatus Bipolaricaulota bacterium]
MIVAVRSWFFALFVAFQVWAALDLDISQPMLGLDHTPFSFARRILSVEDWGRGILLGLGTFLSMFYASLVAILASR